jgi:hypothetical protein
MIGLRENVNGGSSGSVGDINSRYFKEHCERFCWALLGPLYTRAAAKKQDIIENKDRNL